MKSTPTRNLSPLGMFVDMAKHHTPKFSFPKFKGSFEDWKKDAKPQVLDTLALWPEKVDPQAELITEWVDRGVRKRRYLIEVSPGASAALQVNTPEGSKGKLPTIQCWHGHGEHGKNAVMGNTGPAGVNAEIARFNYDYGHQMAQAGFATYGIDWMGIGERNDNIQPHFYNHNVGRDWCDLYFLNATMFGMTSLSINLGHGKAATDFVCTLPEIDGNRLGVMGLSGGGTMTVWSALTDPRFKAAENICYSDIIAKYGIHDLNYCGMQVSPGLYNLVDLPDLQGLIAPTPLLVDIGIHDVCFQVDNAVECFEKVKAIYEKAGAKDNLHLDMFPGDHQWGGHKSVDFFTRYLKA
ncbi:MAG: alpha/beta hydrolase family protein [Chthoniobacterales bacterium]